VPQVRNSKGEVFDVSDVDAQQMTAADPSLTIIGSVDTSAGDGKAPITRDAEDLGESGVTAATAQEKTAASHRTYLKDKTSTVGALTRNALSGASFGGTDNLFDKETLEADQVHHEIASGIGQIAGIAGTIVAAPEEQLFKLFGEGAKLSTGARELAVAGDALSAEKVAGGIGSGTVLADKGGTLAERSLIRTGRTLDEATAARAGIENLPKDLIGLDAAGLKEAAQAEKEALKASAKVEEASLHEARVPMRQQITNEVSELHETLKNEAPIYKAVKGADVQAIEGIKTANVQLAKSFSEVQNLLRNPIKLAESADALKGPLQMRQAALEVLQAKAPELRAVLGNDARAAGLMHVDDALEMTRQQIAKLSEVSGRTPVSSEKLAQLTSGTSQRLQAIEAAQEALKVAPEMGMLAKGAQAAVFGGVTALTHAIPGVGVLAPFVGKLASEGLSRTFERLGEVAKAAGEKSKAALGKFLDVASRNPAVIGGQTATAVLRAAKFADGPEPASSSLRDVYRARTAELRSQTMYDANGRVVIRPEARQAIARTLAPVGQVNPVLADKLETVAVRKAEFMSAMMPRRPDVGGLQIGPDDWAPSSLQMRSWARTVRAVEDPSSVEEDLANGVMTPEAAVAYRTVYPERFAAMQAAIYKAAPTLSRRLPMQKAVALGIFTGIPTIPALQPNVLSALQGAYAMQQEAPKPNPSFGALGSARSPDKQMTQSQQRNAP
jgi:hypothetical protein